ncbi:hypothetical protein ABU178_08570 [Pantoea osteomyelitidis]|uniref:Fumarase D n=1 Tax=Pantoea osteomyelitidis TaxID=3230026 RepID=A0ABW7PY01_9GAMM
MANLSPPILNYFFKHYLIFNNKNRKEDECCFLKIYETSRIKNGFYMKYVRRECIVKSLNKGGVMSGDFSEQAYQAMCSLIGSAAYQVLAEGRQLSNESIAEMIRLLSDDEPDLAEDFALSLLRG